MKTLLRVFFHFLYHQFAFTYDLVSTTVSFGHWQEWIMEVLPFVEGTRVLEIGHGPGHLQRVLLDRGLVTVAIDESAHMGRLTRRNTNNEAQLTRGLAQELPYPNEAFDTIISTFPAEYIYDPNTFSEVKRCLLDGGRFIVLPVATPKNRFLSWLFRVTGQSPSDALQVVHEKLEKPFIQSEFDITTQVIDKPSGTLIIIISTKKEI